MITSFLQQYAIYSQGNECPPNYHTWCALSALSHAIGKRVWTPQGIFTVFPNIYVLLVGPPGMAKSTAVDIARALISDTKACYVLGSATTKEAWLKDFAAEKSPTIQKFFNKETGMQEEFRQTAIFANELLTLVQTGGDPIGYITVLTDIWDRHVFEVKTIGRGSDLIPNPYVSILGCLTPEVTNALISEKVLSTGFSRRCAFVYADRNAPPVPRPTITPQQYAAWDKAKERLHEIRQLSGAFTWSDEGAAYYDAWYMTHAERRNQPHSAALAGFLQSKAGYVIKIAMLLSLSDSDDMVLNPDNLSTAVMLMDQIEPAVDRIFAGTGRNELATVSESIVRLVQQEAGKAPFYIAKKSIMSVFYRDASTNDIENILTHLVSTDRIVLEQITGTNPQGQTISRFVYTTPEGSKAMRQHLKK